MSNCGRREGRHLFTSESVAMGHPDKIADQISDGILDEVMRQDPYGRVAVETLVARGLVIIAGQVTTSCYVDMPAVARDVVKEIGYNNARNGFDYLTCAVLTSIDEQSEDISQGVTEGEGLHDEQGAGDQGVMFGYACNETPEMMPCPIEFAHRIVRRLAEVRFSKELGYLRPDGKSQVTVEYFNDQPQRVHTVVVSNQHAEDVSHETIRNEIIEKVVRPVIPADLIDDNTVFHVNPTGRFVHGGPYADTGLTGRKIIVDTYGGRGSHGGGAFSGKDPTKVDRTASYMARYIAKNIVTAGIAEKLEVQLSYAIGVAQPISVYACAEGTNKIPEDKIERLIVDSFPLTPKEMIDYLKLRRPIYRQTARHGHFGRALPDFTWEKLDRVDELRKAAGL